MESDDLWSGGKGKFPKKIFPPEVHHQEKAALCFEFTEGALIRLKYSVKLILVQWIAKRENYIMSGGDELYKINRR